MLREKPTTRPGPAAGRNGAGPDLPIREDHRNYLFVHGAWHAAAHWNRVTERLAAMGHTVSAIDLPGSGLNAAYPQAYLRGDAEGLVTEPSPVAGIRLADYTNAVVDQLTRMARHGKVTLVGHSFGGLTVTRAAEAAPDLVRRVVYISAYVRVKFPNGAAYGGLPEGASSISGAILIGDPTKTGAMRINPRDSDPDYVERGRMAFYNDRASTRRSGVRPPLCIQWWHVNRSRILVRTWRVRQRTAATAPPGPRATASTSRSSTTASARRSSAASCPPGRRPRR
jgi:pimeloyl-ACP methyl ester carboxylesterase